MKLELKHIAPYLPYGVHLMNSYGNWHNTTLHKSIGVYEMLEMKPILRPMSDLVNNEFEEDLGKWIGEYQELHVDDIDYGIIKNYFKHHFDVFGLIEKGLAISYNDINK